MGKIIKSSLSDWSSVFSLQLLVIGQSQAQGLKLNAQCKSREGAICNWSLIINNEAFSSMPKQISLNQSLNDQFTQLLKSSLGDFFDLIS
jgi:hypothetical protein